MNRKEKVEKISALLASANYEPIENLAVDILDALEEKPAPTFRDNEIVRARLRCTEYKAVRYIQKEDLRYYGKLSPAELAATCADDNDTGWYVNLDGDLYVGRRNNSGEFSRCRRITSNSGWEPQEGMIESTEQKGEL